MTVDNGNQKLFKNYHDKKLRIILETKNSPKTDLTHISCKFSNHMLQ